MNDKVEGPKPTGRTKNLYVTGKIFPWSKGQPVLLSMPGSPHLYLPLFDTIEELEEVMKRGGCSWQSVKQVDDGGEFLTTLLRQKDIGDGSELKIITNIEHLPNGRVRFVEIKEN